MSAWWLIPAFMAGAAVVYVGILIWLMSQANRFWR
jgi:hypothetical protein